MNLKLGDIQIEVMFKNIKKIHLSVYPPSGDVKVSAPIGTNKDTIRAFVLMNLSWVKKEIKRVSSNDREISRDLINRESHYVWGKRYLLEIEEVHDSPTVLLTPSRLIMRVRGDITHGRKQELLSSWYRKQVRISATEIISKYETKLNVTVDRLYVQEMKTLWGSCSPQNKSIRLNTALARKPIEFLEYIVVHEMVHLIERRHGPKFNAILDRVLPDWKRRSFDLNSSDLPAL